MNAQKNDAHDFVGSDQMPSLPEDLIGVFRRIGELGPSYEILGPGEIVQGRLFARLRILKSGGETSYPVLDHDI